VDFEDAAFENDDSAALAAWDLRVGDGSVVFYQHYFVGLFG